MIRTYLGASGHKPSDFSLLFSLELGLEPFDGLAFLGFVHSLRPVLGSHTLGKMRASVIGY
jgi:hypothetical protein